MGEVMAFLCCVYRSQVVIDAVTWSEEIIGACSPQGFHLQKAVALEASLPSQSNFLLQQIQYLLPTFRNQSIYVWEIGHMDNVTISSPVQWYEVNLQQVDFQ